MKTGRIKTTLLLALLVMLLAIPTIVQASNGDNGRGAAGVIYVKSQGLYYDTYATADPLPMHGRFQTIEIGENGPETDYGPGDVGYLGGRWWVDSNGNGEMDEGDHFFVCPLLGPGRETP